MNKQTEALKLALEALNHMLRQAQENLVPTIHYGRVQDVMTAIREALAEQPAKEKAPQSANCEAPGWISSDHARGDDCTTEQPSTVTDNSQEWRGMDGATAYWLIQRHADGWADIGKMMDEWRVANQPAQQQEPGRSCNDAYELIMKWADIYAAQTGRIYSEAAQDPTKTAKMADERTMLACAVAQALSQPAQQEPMAVARVDDLERGGRVRALAMGLSLDAPLYTSPPASKQWVGLTDEEIEQVCVPLGAAMLSFTEVARAIEAKLRDKNT